MIIRALCAALFFNASAALAEDRAFDAQDLTEELASIVKGRGGAEPVAGAALVVMVGDEIVFSGAAGCAEFDATHTRKCLRPIKPTSKLRVASISKMALAMGFATLAEAGRADFDRDISDYLGWRLVNPNFPDLPITARRLLSHTSSIRDPEEYWVAAPGKFRNFIVGAEELFAAPSLGGAEEAIWFKYANINYGILAGLIERAANQRFDLYMSEHVFGPAGLDIGYNWSGVSANARKVGAALVERDGKGWRTIVDGPTVLGDNLPYFLASDTLNRAEYLENYAPGENPTLFSPQGGLRASTADLAALVRLLNRFPVLTSAAWEYDPASPNGDSEAGFYSAYGLGVQIIDGGPDLLPNEVLIGHAGEAYGLYSGAWLLKKDEDKRREDVAIAYVVIGAGDALEKGSNPSFYAIEERIIRLAAKAIPTAASSEATNPRPFDESANAMQDVDAALLSARSTGKMPLLVLGGNWCHDSRGLAAKFEVEPLKTLIGAEYQIVWIDVGHRDRNLDVAARFGVDKIIGTPTVIILSPDGEILNAGSVHDWRTADSKSFDETLSYFESFVRR